MQNEIYIPGPPPFPISEAPELIKSAMTEAAEFTQAPDALVGSAFLAAVSLACQNSINVQRFEGLSGPCSLIVLILAESGERKSAVDNLATKAFQDFDEEQIELSNLYSAQHKAARTTWNIELKVIQSAIEKAIIKGQDTTEFTQRLEELFKREPAAPICRRMLYGDTTAPGFKYELRHKSTSVGIFSDEAKVVVNAGVLNDMAMLNKAWDGGKMHITRRTSESFDVTDARVTTSLMFQPDIFRKAFREGKSDAREVGYLARTLIAYPLSTQGTRFKYDPTAPLINLAHFNKRISEILHQNMAAIATNTHERKTLKFSDDAQQVWLNGYNNTEHLLGPGGYLSDIKDFGAKYADNVARIAALFHYFEGEEGNEISVNTLRQASIICEWYLNEFKRLFSPRAQLPSIPQVELDAMALERALIRYFVKTRFYWVDKSHLATLGPLRPVARLEPAINVLIQRGLLSNITKPPLAGRKARYQYGLDRSYFDEAAIRDGSMLI